MNWKGFERKQSWHNLRYYQGIFMEKQRKTMRELTVAGAPAEIRTEHLKDKT
jgi:hypothetical protein